MITTAKKDMINIPRTVEDEFYRYKMPKLVAKVEGRGNGIKTVIVNMVDIATSLERPPSYPTKYFGFELGAQTKCDEKNDKWIVNGRHDQETLAALLDGFIEKFVLCKTCGNPETIMAVSKAPSIELRCMACGNISAVEMGHRLCTFILKHPPTNKKYIKVQEKVKEQKTQENENGTGTLNVTADDKKMTAEDKAIMDDSTWSTDTSAEAVEKRRLELVGGTALAKTLVIDEEKRQEEDDKMNDLAQFLNKDPRPNNNEILKYVRELQNAEGWKDTRIVQVIFGTLFDKDIAKQIKMKGKLKTLELFVKSERDQKMTLFCLEKLCEAEPSVIARVANILNALYDADILEENIILKWHKHPIKKIDQKVATDVREKAQPFIKWLESAEEDDE